MNRWLIILADSFAQGLGWAVGVMTVLATIWDALKLPTGGLF